MVIFNETFESYRDTKKYFFDQLGNKSFAITNNDDKNGLFMLQNTKAEKYSYSLNSVSDFKARILESSSICICLFNSYFSYCRGSLL